MAWFDNIIAFHQVWNRIPHAKVGSILCDGEKFKFFKDYEGRTYQVTVLMLFKYPILPQYEDKRNKAELRLDLGHIKDVEYIQLVWETLVLDMVTGNCPGITDNEDEGVFVDYNDKNDWRNFGGALRQKCNLWTNGPMDQ